jgi:hypothetical protein
MSMPALANTFGGLLVAIGLITFGLSESKSPTALIPAYLGGMLVICGILAAKKPNLRKHMMHVAALLGLLGTSVLFMVTPKLLGGSGLGLAQGSQLATGILSLIFLVLCIRSFIAARRARTELPE